MIIDYAPAKEFRFLVIGARRGTEAAEKIEDLRPFIDRHQFGFYDSVECKIFPAGTLALFRGIWYEVIRDWKYGRNYFHPVIVEEPGEGEIVK